MKKTHPVSSRGVAALALLAAFLTTHRLHAQTTWTGGGTDDLWSNPANWSSGVPTTASIVTLGETDKTSASTPNSIVAANTTITQLLFKNSGTTSNDWQVLNINSGVTLTASDTVTVGGITSTGVGDTVTTQAKLTGAGTFLMNASTKAFSVGNTNSASSATATSYATLDASGLAQFNVYASSVRVGYGQESAGTLQLGQTGNIYATTLYVGYTNGSGGGIPNATSAIYMGNSTLLQVDAITIGGQRTNGLLDFQSGLSGTPTVTIQGRSTSTTTRADMTVGTAANQYTLVNPLQATADFTGGTVNALLNNLTVGTADRNGRYGTVVGSGGGVTASVSMDAGLIDATTVVLGRSTNTETGQWAATAAAGTATGTLTVNGGTFKAGSITLGQSSGQAATGIINIAGTGVVEVSGNIVMGSQGSTTSTAAAQAAINLTQGTLAVGGDIAKGTNAGPGTVTATINLGGGTLDMTHGTISVDTFAFTGGTLKNVTAFTAATTGGLNVQSASTLAYDLDASFTTLALTGALTLGANSNLSLTLADGFTPSASYTLVANDSTDTITGTFLTINGGAFGAGNTFTLTNNTGTYNATLNYLGGDGNDLMLVVTSAIPEPSMYAVFAGLGVLGLGIRRRRR